MATEIVVGKTLRNSNENKSTGPKNVPKQTTVRNKPKNPKQTARPEKNDVTADHFYLYNSIAMKDFTVVSLINILGEHDIHASKGTKKADLYDIFKKRIWVHRAKLLKEINVQLSAKQTENVLQIRPVKSDFRIRPLYEEIIRKLEEVVGLIRGLEELINETGS
jgi:hypothetical protein